MTKVLRESEVADLPNAITEHRWYLFCPGCYQAHKERYPNDERFWINGALHCFNDTVHQFNGDVESPTLSPSLLVSYPFGEAKTKYTCHSYVKDGKIQFLGDCTHALANQTVELMDASLYLDTLKQRPEDASS